MNCSARPDHPFRTALVLAAIVAFLGSHIASALRHPEGALVLAGIQTIATGAALAVTLPSRRWLGPVLSVALLLALVLGARWSPAAGLLAQTGAAHAFLYTALVLAFARSLRPGQIARVASAVNPNFHLGMVPYTRAVTGAWVVFFAAQLLASAILLATNFPLWRLFVTALHLPFVAVMALAELAIRQYRWRHESPTGLLETIRGTRRLWAQRAANSSTTR